MKRFASYLKAPILALLDSLEALGVLASRLVFAPARIFQQSLRVSDWAGFGLYCLPRGFLATYLRGQTELSLQHYEKASGLFSYLALQIEKDLKEQGPQKRRLAVTSLTKVYSILFRAQFGGGRVEAAASTLIRASKTLGLDRLPDVQDFDARTAHIVKAGIAASRLLDEGGLATLMVKQGENPVVSKGRMAPPPSPHAPLKNSTHKSLTRQPSMAVRNKRPKGDGAKVIPFPTLH